MKKSNSGMPQDKQWQKDEGKLGYTSNLKYSSEMGNPKELSKNCEALANYVKKNEAKH